ncbi:hypothetical protein PHYPSEUDO_009239 [Phytophthora pseudosyringae]|uniref:WRKY19-like zinc finger domain-containing protein n=1 Tax=Phytophthora pseudosyringae TaxID=221518 RepID=A0A8T1VFS2_9STRA|nr:hypothetical protein PHYPSEUDO_009239 [Phytophthora pseudosyringae]
MPAPSRRRKAARCSAPNCTKQVQTRRLCKAHGGGVRCRGPGCTKLAQSRGLCVAHGGGRRCASVGCAKLAQYKGVCLSHGGGRRCFVSGCHKFVQLRGGCKAHLKVLESREATKALEGTDNPHGTAATTHSGERCCVFDGCSNLAEYMDLCFSHGGSRYCRAPGCHKYAQIRACCKSHANLLGPPESTCSVAKLQASPAHASPPPTSNGFKNAMGDVAHPVLPHILYRGDSQASAPRVASCDKILPHLASRFVIPKRPATDLDTLKTFSTKESTALELFRPYCRRLYCQPRLMQGNL